MFHLSTSPTSITFIIRIVSSFSGAQMMKLMEVDDGSRCNIVDYTFNGNAWSLSIYIYRTIKAQMQTGTKGKNALIIRNIFICQG